MDSPVKIFLQYRVDQGGWEEFSLEEGEITLGRGSDCELQIDHHEVSRHHLLLSRKGDQIFVTDLESTNGTMIEGQRIEPGRPHTLAPGQSFRAGGCSLRLGAPDAIKTSLVEEVPPGEMVTTLEQPESVPDEIPPSEGPEPAKPVPAPAGYRVKYRLGSGGWHQAPCPEGELNIGRWMDSDLKLIHPEVSRRHASLKRDGDALWITDLGSSNGTQVEGQPLPPRVDFRIKPGQPITIGGFTLYVDPPSGVEPPEVASPAAAAAGLQPVTPDISFPGGEKTVFFTEGDLDVPTEMRALDLSRKDKVSIGRAGDNDVVLNHPMVSRYHSIIERMGTRYRVQDLRSSNGVYINGQRIETDAWLKDSDEIRIGPYAFVLFGNNLQAQAETGLKLEAVNLRQQVSKDLNLLKDISLSIKPLEFVALVGMSGSGKTTLLNALSGYRPASHGRVMVNGIDLYQHYNLFRNDIGYVPQKDIVHQELTPKLALDYAARLRMPPDTIVKEREAVIMEVLGDLDLTERKDVPIHRLSGGQLKRVSIGVELLTKPRLFFLDEPTSGLDPGTEYEMMKLMRRLADQGRTVILITHATKNVMLCDKVIFLARGGHVSYFGPPEDALRYFDQFRTPREQREKEMEFDDIYRILNDESRGNPEQWGQRYLQSPDYRRALAPPGSASEAAASVPRSPKRKDRVSGLRQLKILSQRNLRILFQDKVSLALMLALAPGIGLLDFIWGRDLFDPVGGDVSKILTMWFMLALVTILVGALSSVREIVKEVDIYKRERAVNLKIIPYVMSKVWVGVFLALYQAGVLLAFRLAFVNPTVPSPASYVALYITLFIATICGYLIGLAISASAPNQNAAMLMTIGVLVPQFLFAGALLPLDLIPGGKAISVMMPTRWAFEAFVRVTGMGEKLTEDPCWEFPKADRQHLPDELKEACPCLGANIFTQCAEFPGILSPDFYDETAQLALSLPKPEEPAQPTAYPYPTAYPSPTPLPTPTPLPSPTPNPTPSDPRLFEAYMDQQRDQGQEYQDRVLDQFEVYRVQSQEQGQWYSERRTEQGDQYAELREEQGDEYQSVMQDYGDARAEWQENREKAISSAEALLDSVYDNFGQTLTGTATERWLAMGGISLVLVGAILFFQKRKDVV